MVVIDGTECPDECLIEICMLPGANANLLVRDLQKQNPKSILIENTLNLTLLGLNAFYIPTHHGLFQKLDEIRCTWLIIDSIALYVDSIRESEDETKVQVLYNRLWDLIYHRNVTVIAINHFKTKKDPLYYRVVPRLGFSWYRMCSYRIIVTMSSDGVATYKISKNTMIES